MAYRTKVEVQTNGKVYAPGSILPTNMSKIDMDFLKKRKFIELVEIDERVAAADEIEEDDEDRADGDMFDELAPGGYKSADEVRKIRTKKELYTYALSIGLGLGNDYEERKVGDLADEVINFQEEKEADAVKSFKEQLEKDLDSVFFNMDEFAETHMIDGKEVPIVLDNDRIIELSMGKTVETRGIFTDDILFFVQKKDLDYEPVAGQHMEFDGEMYPISDVKEDFGGYTIILTGNQD